MITATFTELRNHAKAYFDKVEHGETVEVFRNGKPVAVLAPYKPAQKDYWKHVSPIKMPGLSLSRWVLSERRKGR